jgi:hypothetical protein
MTMYFEMGANLKFKVCQCSRLDFFFVAKQRRKKISYTNQIISL